MLSLNLPESLLDRLNRLARAAQRPVEDLVIATLNESVPCPPSGLPGDIREELTALETLSDDELLHVARSTMEPEQAPAPYQPGDVTDRIALRKAYALVLLKWRGHRLDELERLTDLVV
jgi:hypothetical protein